MSRSYKKTAIKEKPNTHKSWKKIRVSQKQFVNKFKNYELEDILNHNENVPDENNVFKKEIIANE